jgi:hypothetical protein
MNRGSHPIAVRVAIHSIAENCGPTTRKLLLEKRSWITDKVILQISRTAPPRQREAIEHIRAGIRPLRRKSAVFDTTGYAEVLSRLARAGGWINKGMHIAERLCISSDGVQEDIDETLAVTNDLLENCGKLWHLIRDAYYKTPQGLIVTGRAFIMSKRKSWRNLRKHDRTTRAARSCLNFANSFISKCVRDLARAKRMYPSREQAHNALTRLYEMIQIIWRIRLAVERAKLQRNCRSRRPARIGKRSESDLAQSVDCWLERRGLSTVDVVKLSEPNAVLQNEKTT